MFIYLLMMYIISIFSIYVFINVGGNCGHYALRHVLYDADYCVCSPWSFSTLRVHLQPARLKSIPPYYQDRTVYSL